MSKQQYKGFYGAKVSSWTRGNPRAVLIKVMEAHPKASREVIVDMFQRTIREEQHVDDLSSIIEQWATNNVNDLENHREKAKPKTRAEIIAEQKKAADRAAAKAAALAAALKNVQNHRKEEAKVLVLDMRMPNGKKLRFCKGSELKKFGNAFMGLSKLLKPDELCGNLGEDVVAKLYNES